MSIRFSLGELPATKDAIKLHVGLNHEGYLPEFVTITEGKTHDVIIGRTLKFPKGSIVAIDRGYNDYAWYNQLTEKVYSLLLASSLTQKPGLCAGGRCCQTRG